MRRSILLVLLLASGCAVQEVEASSGQNVGDGQECFFGSQVSGFTDGGPDRVLVRRGFREGWELTVSAGCPPINFAHQIGIASRTGDRICPGRPAQLVIPRASGTGFERCLVTDVRRLSDQEVEAAWGQS